MQSTPMSLLRAMESAMNERIKDRTIISQEIVFAIYITLSNERIMNKRSMLAITRPETTIANPIFDLILASKARAKKTRMFAKSNNSTIISIPHDKQVYQAEDD
jgi:hypothetical protein